MVLDVVRASPSPHPPFFFFWSPLPPRAHPTWPSPSIKKSRIISRQIRACQAGRASHSPAPALDPFPSLLGASNGRGRRGRPGKRSGTGGPASSRVSGPARRFVSRASHLASVCLYASLSVCLSVCLLSLISQSSAAWLAATTSALLGAALLCCRCWFAAWACFDPKEGRLTPRFAQSIKSRAVSFD